MLVLKLISLKYRKFNDELKLTQKLEELLDREIDLIDINDENVKTQDQTENKIN